MTINCRFIFRPRAAPAAALPAPRPRIRHAVVAQRRARRSVAALMCAGPGTAGIAGLYAGLTSGQPGQSAAAGAPGAHDGNALRSASMAGMTLSQPGDPPVAIPEPSTLVVFAFSVLSLMLARHLAAVRAAAAASR